MSEGTTPMPLNAGEAKFRKQSGGGGFTWLAKQKTAEPLVVPRAAGASGHSVAIELGLAVAWSIRPSENLTYSVKWCKITQL